MGDGPPGSSGILRVLGADAVYNGDTKSNANPSAEFQNIFNAAIQREHQYKVKDKC